MTTRALAWPEVMGADTLIGNDVCNRQDENLGEVKEIMLDMSTGKVAYAVLAYGGVLGLGDKLFAVPWNALELDTENKRFVLDIDKEALKTAPDSTRMPGRDSRIPPGARTSIASMAPTRTGKTARPGP